MNLKKLLEDHPWANFIGVANGSISLHLHRPSYNMADLIWRSRGKQIHLPGETTAICMVYTKVYGEPLPLPLEGKWICTDLDGDTYIFYTKPKWNGEWWYCPDKKQGEWDEKTLVSNVILEVNPGKSLRRLPE